MLWIRSGFNADPDQNPTYLNADPDPGSQTNADPDMDPGQTSVNFYTKNIHYVGNRS